MGSPGADKDTVKNFLKTLADNNRLGILEGVCEKFGVLMGASRGEVELVVISAQVCYLLPLSIFFLIRRNIQATEQIDRDANVGTFFRVWCRNSIKKPSNVSKPPSRNLNTAKARNSKSFPR